MKAEPERPAVFDAVLMGDDLDQQSVRAVVTWLAGVIKARAPGRSIELRLPPYLALQCGGPDGDGPRHTRGTPPNTIEMDPMTFIQLAAGQLTWLEALQAGRVRASGRLADLSWVLPLL